MPRPAFPALLCLQNVKTNIQNHPKKQTMKTTITSIALTVIALAGILTAPLKAQETSVENQTTFSFETDPSTFAFKGYAFHIRIKPKNSTRLVLGAGTYGLDLPGAMVDMNDENKNKGWKVRINSAYSLFGEYYLKEANQKWFLGLQVGLQNYKNTNDNHSGKESTYTNLLVMPSIGYTWQPKRVPVYVKPWFGLGYTTKTAGSNAIEQLEYAINPLVPFLTVHIGYTFK
jgi:hypothetical protein